MKRPLIIADSHGVSFSSVFGELKDPWASDGIFPVSIAVGEQKVGDYYVLNSKSRFFVRISSKEGDVIDVDPSIEMVSFNNERFYDSCLVSIDGNVHMANFMCQNGPLFDFYWPDCPKFISGNRQIIPSWTLKKFFARGKNLLVAKLWALRRHLRTLPIYFIAPPLPIPSERQIHDNAEIFNFSVQRLEDPYLRLKIFHLYCHYLEEVCREAGVLYIPPNNQAGDAEGFLLEEYWLAATHAKTGYYSFLESL